MEHEHEERSTTATRDALHRDAGIGAVTRMDMARRALYSAADVVRNQRGQLIGQAPPEFIPTLWDLFAAATGHVMGEPLDARARLGLLDMVMRNLASEIDLYGGTPEGQQWLDEQVLTPVRSLRTQIRFQEASERVRGSVVVGNDKIIEGADHAEPRQQAAILHGQLPTLVKDLSVVNDLLVHSNEEAIHHAAEQMIKEHQHGARFGSLAELQNLLLFADGFLTMTDDEFQQHLQHVQGFWNGLTTYSEFVRATAQLAGGATLISMSLISKLASITGNMGVATTAAGLARSFGLKFSDLIAGVEVVHGLAVLLDPHASRQDKIDAGVDGASGLAWLVGKRVGAAAGTAASLAVMAGYAELKWVLGTYWEAALGINTGLMLPALQTLQRDGAAIARYADDITKAELIGPQETHAEKSAALVQFIATRTHQLGGAIAYLIDDCAPTAAYAGVAAHPGAYPILREAFAPLLRFRDLKSPDTIVAAAKVAIECTTWVLTHAGELISAATRQQSLQTVRDSEEAE